MHVDEIELRDVVEQASDAVTWSLQALQTPIYTFVARGLFVKCEYFSHWYQQMTYLRYKLQRPMVTTLRERNESWQIGK